MADFLENILAGAGTVGGTLIGGPAGGAIGGALGRAAGSAFDNDDRNGRRRRQRRGGKLRKLFEDRYDRLKKKSPTETATFRSGSSALREALGEQAERDASAAAARGLTGSAFELAQKGDRTEALASGMRRLVGESERRLTRDRESALRGILSAARFEEDVRARRQRRRDRRKSRLAQIVGSALEAGTTILGSQLGSGGSSNAPSGTPTGRAQRGLLA